MNWWSYEIHDAATHALLKKDTGFETEEDAELHGWLALSEISLQTDAKAKNINYYIRTLQEWEDL